MQAKGPAVTSSDTLSFAAQADRDPPPLRFGIICAGPTFDQWQAECIRRVMRQGAVLALIIENHEPSDEHRVPAWRQLWSRTASLVRNGNLLWAVLHRLATGRCHAFEAVDLSAELNSTPRSRYCALGSGECGTDGVDVIRQSELDFILNFTTSIVHGDILDAARLGVWSFVLGNEIAGRGGSAGFWEILEGRSSTESFLVRLYDRPEHWVVLAKGATSTEPRYSRNLNSALMMCASWPERIVSRLRYSDTFPTSQRFQAAVTRNYGRPTERQVLHYLAQSRIRELRELCMRLSVREWNIGLARLDARLIEGQVVVSDVVWLKRHGRTGFVADPFLLGAHDGEVTILAEEFVENLGRGRITQIDVLANGQVRAEAPAIESAVHLSYPHIVEHDGERYCIPEAASTNSVQLHRWLGEERRWALERTLLQGVAALDPTLFRHDGRWWLFYTDWSYGATNNLCLQFSDDLFGPWTAHPMNPVKMDVRSSRPAGPIFMVGSRVIRPSQDCAGDYGTAVTLNHVTRLTTTEFEETAFCRVSPDQEGPYPAGLHTLVMMGDRVIIDGQRFTFAPLRKLRLRRRESQR